MTKAEWASNLLLDEYFKEMLKELEQIELNRFANSDEFDYEGRQQAYIKLQAIRGIKSHIQGMADSIKINEKRYKIW